ncbi:hypothetical protein M422DRAFT_243512 [Sphaerobolus stellatus SS14]|nr:hypothetical protein M422DRAFT_243512 [Sphaerobolus stellatus SS14]
MAFRPNEKPLIQKVYEAVPRVEIRLIASQLPITYIPELLQFIASQMEKSPHIEFDLLWINAVLAVHGRYLRDRSTQFASIFRSLQRGLLGYQEMISRICGNNNATLTFILDQQHVRATAVEG